ncbi:unnamed protein product [Amoebophrya sp. A120]|nr:unnamed protein product [Amoebophrya sp. A120]|eukprot:GSA120T00020646001.1
MEASCDRCSGGRCTMWMLPPCGPSYRAATPASRILISSEKMKPQQNPDVPNLSAEKMLATLSPNFEQLLEQQFPVTQAKIPMQASDANMRFMATSNSLLIVQAQHLARSKKISEDRVYL